MREQELPAPRDAQDTAPPATARSDRLVQEASEESFPASDPPQFTRARAGSPDDVADVHHEGGEAQRDARVWAQSFVDALDHDDHAALMQSFTEDAVLRIGTGELRVGHAAIATTIAEWVEAIGTTRHQIVDVRVAGDALFIESDVTYQTADGKTGTWPEVISARLRLGAASRLVIYGAPTIVL